MKEGLVSGQGFVVDASLIHCVVGHCAIEPTSEPGGFAFTGSQRGWSSACPGKPMQTVLRTLVADPVVIVDEVEKAGQVSDTKGRSHDPTAARVSAD